MKKELIKEFIKFLSTDGYNFNKEQSLNTCLIIDFMPQIRKLPNLQKYENMKICVFESRCCHKK